MRLGRAGFETGVTERALTTPFPVVAPLLLSVHGRVNGHIQRAHCGQRPVCVFVFGNRLTSAALQ
jgi:hypothetical protein